MQSQKDANRSLSQPRNADQTMQEIKKTDLFGSQKNAFANAEVLLPQKRGRKSQAIKPGANAEEPEELKFDEYGNKVGPNLKYSPQGGYGDFS